MIASRVVEIPPGARGLVREACACGVDLIATGRSDQEKEEAVLRHATEPVHNHWAALQGFRGEMQAQVAWMAEADRMAERDGRASALRPRWRADRAPSFQVGLTRRT